ncbi:MAG: alanine--tRNA ligase-related protein [Marinilabiliales bacterium]|nr:alanine--tRNA ligase-related protein [Marinilabiliales bacterium]
MKTLETGIRLLNQLAEKAIHSGSSTIDGRSAFRLYDTYGFPLDLTELILREMNLNVDKTEFENEMLIQKNRSGQQHQWKQVIGSL